MTANRAKRFAKGLLLYSVIIGAALALFDGITIALGLFPPSHNYGDAELGWRPARPTGHVTQERCTEYSTGETISYQRNEDGVRTTISRDARNDTAGIRIAVTGDSQTDLCASNQATHAGALEAALRAAGMDATVLAYGAGRYSPLQSYLAFRSVLLPYHPDILVLNLYTGNDFYDLLRADDRPHLVASDSGYRIAPPEWFSYDPPETRRNSRVLFLLRTLANRTGIRGMFVRVRQLRAVAAEQHQGFGAVVAYLKDLVKANEPSLGYPAALSAQMLNQQLFFRHFPGSEEESLRRLEYLLHRIRAENPDMLLLMSPLPSYLLTRPEPLDSAVLATLQRLHLGVDEAVKQEGDLYEKLRTLAAQAGWLFVDNLAVLKDHRDSTRFYNGFDYHLLPPASALIGRAQAAVLRSALSPAAPR